MTREEFAALLFPRRCPFCGHVLRDDAPQAAFCGRCQDAEYRLRHQPPRLPRTEHHFYGVSGAAGVYYYADEVRRAILLCKAHGHPWYATELADRMAVCLWGAEPASRPARRPVLEHAGLAAYEAIVPVPSGHSLPGVPGLPMLLARRLSEILKLPVLDVLELTRPIQPQKTLQREQRFSNTRGAYAVRKGETVEGKRILLVDDIITTGCTVSACAEGLLKAGAADVFAVCIAAEEELPKEKKHNEAAGHRH